VLVDMILAQAGRMDAASSAAAELAVARPGFTIQAWRDTQFRNDYDQLTLDLESLRSAGVPER
jgi:hypothetical protein